MKNEKMARGGQIIPWGILLFWALFWGLNVVDKFIGGSGFLWVGKDRLAQMVKFFSSIGIENTKLSLVVLLFITLIEIAALVFILGALIGKFKQEHKTAKRMYFWGTFMGLVVFSFFSIGDQIFGDRFELLEHSLYWMVIVVSWGAYNYYPRLEEDNDSKKFSFKLVSAIVCIYILSFLAIVMIAPPSLESLENNPEFVEAVEVGNGVYRFELDFMANRSVFENSLMLFMESNEDLEVVDIFAAPSELKSKAENSVIYLLTEEKDLDD